MKNASKIADLIRLVVGMKRNTPYVVLVNAQCGSGVHVAILRRHNPEDEIYEFEFVHEYRDIDKREEHLQAAFAITEAIAAGTYAGEGGEAEDAKRVEAP